MTSVLAVVVVVAAVCTNGAVADAPCDQSIVAKLSTVKECYSGGKAPSLTSYNTPSTMVKVSSDVWPTGALCVSAFEKPGSGLVEIHTKNGSSQSLILPQVLKGTYIQETEENKISSRVYVTHNQNHVYAYYRCIETPGTKGTGSPMFAIYVECKYKTDPGATNEITLAQKCAENLGIKNLVAVTPCKC